MTAVPPPPAARRDDVVDVVHGVAVPDPYRWLEDGEAPDTQAWVAAQNARTRAALDALPDRGAWHERLLTLLAAPVSIGVRVAGDAVFSLEREGGAPQHRLVVRSATDPEAGPRVLVDPAALSPDATTAIDWYHPSPDGGLIAYGTSEGGDENSVLHVLDVVTGDPLPDTIADTRACSIGWLPGAKGFLYTRYPPGDEYHRRVFRHHLGDEPAADELVWDELPRPEAWPEVTVSPDGRHALVTVMISWAHLDVHLLDLATGTARPVISGVEARTELDFTAAGDRLVGTTTLDAPRGRVVAVALDDPSPPAWTTLVAEGDEVLDGARAGAGALYVRSTYRAVARLRRYPLDDTPAVTGGGADIDLGGAVSFAGFDVEPTTGLAVAQVESFARPSVLARVEGDRLVPWAGAGGVAEATTIAVHQRRYRALDGIEIGLFLVHRADAVPGPETPAILNGYGGFAITETPLWSPSIAAWCERGGLFAIAGLRGGLEEGEAWHHAGRREHKQRVFDDFLAAADHLVAAGLTSRRRLALRGRSNGGLLVGAALTQRPDLAWAVDCGVPLLDMVRFPRFLIARLWTSEYGDPDIAEEFAWLHAYSPYHHVVQGTAYPAVLLTCAEGDTRVDPLHARKMAAALQWASSAQDERPILLRQESRAGHGVGKPLHKQANEAADQLAFCAWQLEGP